MFGSDEWLGGWRIRLIVTHCEIRLGEVGA